MAVTRLPDEIRPVLDNGIPAVMVTCSADGKPNTTIISQVYYVDETHVALSFQFFSKTIRNVRENPRAFVCVSDLAGHANWVLELVFERSETEGPIFDVMDMQIEAIASMTGMSGIFKLRAADVYRVLTVEKRPYTPAEVESAVNRARIKAAVEEERGLAADADKASLGGGPFYPYICERVAVAVPADAVEAGGEHARIAVWAGFNTQVHELEVV
jgi:hypothetical protein